jgi:hypothetical protein
MNPPCLSTRTRQIIRDRRILKTRRERLQRPLLSDKAAWKATIEAKLIGIATGNQMNNFAKCGVEEIWQTCENCGTVEKFHYSCNRKWCPLCNYKLAAARGAKLRLWTRTINQPKHLVLTMRNFEVLTRKKIRQFQKALVALRRQEVFSLVKGGCATLEITNDKRGWHLHAHLLLDVRWLVMPEVSRCWGALVNQEFGIVKIKDCRGADYLHEVAKYVAKGSEIASWPAEQIWEFICAIKGCRFFFAFGSLFHMSKEIKRQILEEKGERKKCHCGCGRFIYDSEASAAIKDARSMSRR